MNEKDNILEKVDAVVVTYNRKILALECIKAILNQTYSVDKVIIIDNNSKDNTYEYLKENNIIDNPKVKYFKLKKNIGGAGGFYEGMNISKKDNCDWTWIMDDDTIPNEKTLEKLLKKKEILKKENISFLASSVYGLDGLGMNTPVTSDKVGKNGCLQWNKYLKYGIVQIKEATFVSLLINKKAIKKCGLPIADYFIWGDDIEYTNRLTKYFGNAFLIGESEVIHKRKNGKNTTILDEDEIQRINNYYYMIRNNLINSKLYGGKIKVIKHLIRNEMLSIRILFSKTKYKAKKYWVVKKGVWAYLTKRYDYKAIKHRMDIINEK